MHYIKLSDILEIKSPYKELIETEATQIKEATALSFRRNLRYSPRRKTNEFRLRSGVPKSLPVSLVKSRGVARLILRGKKWSDIRPLWLVLEFQIRPFYYL